MRKKERRQEERKERGGEGGMKQKKRDLLSREHFKNASFGGGVLPNRACSPECPGSWDHSAYCGKDQGRKVSNTPLDAEYLPPSLSGCALSGACSGQAGRLEGKVSRSKQQRYQTVSCPYYHITL